MKSLTTNLKKKFIRENEKSSLQQKCKTETDKKGRSDKT